MKSGEHIKLQMFEFIEYLTIVMISYPLRKHAYSNM